MTSPTQRASNVWEVNGGDDVLQIQSQGGQVLGGISSTAAGFGALATPTVSGCVSNCSYVLTTSDQQWIQPSTTATFGTANTIQAVRFYNNATRGLGNACIRLVAGSSGGHVDVGVYDSNGNLIWHMGAQSTTTANSNLCASATPATLAANTNYYIAWTMDNNVATLGAAANQTFWDNINFGGAPAHTFGINSTDTSTAGVLPNTMTLNNIVNNVAVNIPYVQVFL